MNIFSPKALQAQRHTAAKLFLDGRLSDAIKAQHIIVNAQKNAADFPIEDYRCLAHFLFSARKFDGAVEVLGKIQKQVPGDFRVLRDLGRNLILLARPQEALIHLENARDLQSHDAEIHDLLAHAYGLTGDLEQAAKSGDISLLLKANEASHLDVPPLPSKQPPAFSGDVPSRNIIAFNLSNLDTLAIRRALFNARNALGLYPQWRCRFYVPANTPQHVLNKIIAVGAQAMEVSGKGRLQDSSMWNLHVLEDENVDYFLLRDLRCTVNVREQAAVHDWLRSGRWFHIMRDSYTHTDLVMPGMWGGARGGLPGVRELLSEIDPEAPQTGSLLRTLLKRGIWPRVRRSVCIHDSLHRIQLHDRVHGSVDAFDFPAGSDLPRQEYVGQASTPPENLERRARKRDEQQSRKNRTDLIETENDRIDFI